MGLPGVKVGPLDPDSTSGFGQVAAKNSARQLIRLHKQMYPPALLQALTRPRDDPRSKAVLENLDEVQTFAEGLAHENGDKVLPEGAIVNGASVRGDRAMGQVITFTYRIPGSRRVGKWFAPYRREDMPEAYDAGEQFTKVQQMKDRGVVALDEEGTHNAILQRHNNDLTREVRTLRAFVDGQGQGGDPPAPGDVHLSDTRGSVDLAESNEQLGRQVQELQAKLALYEGLEQAQGGGVPTQGLDEQATTTPAPGPDASSAAENPPFEAFDSMKADDLVRYLRADERTQEERQAVLDFESKHSNRRTVIGAAEESLTANA